MNSLTSNLTKTFFLLAAAFIAAVMALAIFGAAPAEAKGKAVYYEATLAAPAEVDVKIIQGTVWQCEGNVCRAAKSRTRDKYACSRLASRLGEVTAFSTPRQTFDAAAIAKCNGQD